MDSPDTIMIPMTTAVAVLTSVIGALVTAVVWLARWGREESRGRLEDAAKASMTLRTSEMGRLEDQRGASKVLRKNQERVLPLLERCAIVLKDISDRAAKKRALEDSDPPQRVSSSALEEPHVRIQRAQAEIEEVRKSYPEILNAHGVRK